MLGVGWFLIVWWGVLGGVCCLGYLYWDRLGFGNVVLVVWCYGCDWCVCVWLGLCLVVWGLVLGVLDVWWFYVVGSCNWLVFGC